MRSQVSKQESLNLESPVVLIIGGARGIGHGCAVAFQDDGWRVVIADKTLEPEPSVFVEMTVDVSVSESVDRVALDVVKRFGRLDAVVNTAGFTNQGPTPDVSDGDWDAMLDVHLGGAFKVSRACARHMSDNGGSIVFFSSIAGAMGLPYRASYCASKAGIEGLTRSLAVEFAERGIRVNAVAPGWIDTGLISKDLTSGLVSDAVLKTRISLRRMGTIEEVASVVAFLCSPGARYITGQSIAVDGGLSIDLDPGDRRAALGRQTTPSA